jgi:hypothetical protein
MSVWAIITLAIIVINFFWTKIAHNEYVGDLPPAWINRVTNVPWLIANAVWWIFAAVGIYLSINFYFSGDFIVTVACAIVLAYSFVRRTPKAYRNLPSVAVSKLTFIPTWAMVVVGLTDGAMVYFALFFALWSLTASVMQGRFIHITRVLSEALDAVRNREEAEVAA